MSFLTLKNITKHINNKNILDNVNLNVEEGEFIILLGSSGCGKTTLLRIISGLEKEFYGNIYLENHNITKVPPNKRNFGMVFQNYSLFPNMTVEANIAYGLKNKKYTRKEIHEKIDSILEIIDMIEYKKKYPHELSGGQQQRVALARTLVLSPKVLFLDEPLSALDYKVRINIREQIKNIQKHFKITTIMVTHDQEEALVMADRIAIMQHGKIIQIDNPEDIYMNPTNEYIANFIGELNVVQSLNNNYKFIRPEDIKYSFEKKENYEKAIIESFEFRGSFYRVNLSLKKYIDKIKINVMLQDKINLKEKGDIYIKFSKFLNI